jgi:adenylate cyclase
VAKVVHPGYAMDYATSDTRPRLPQLVGDVPAAIRMKGQGPSGVECQTTISCQGRIPEPRCVRFGSGLANPWFLLRDVFVLEGGRDRFGSCRIGMRAVLYSFESISLDTKTRELRRAGKLLSIEPKVFDLLAHLIENHERVISKDALIAALWDGRTVSDSALTTCINAARVALGDSGKEQRLIKTLPRKGFRFVGTLREMPTSSAAVREAPPKSTSTALPLPDRPSIAVLPFAILGDDLQQEYLADGIVEDIIIELSRFSELFDITRNSSFQYKGKVVDVRQIGHELGVRYVLDGSLRRRGEHVRITAQLVDAESGHHRWADRYDCDLENVFEIHDEVAKTIATILSAHLNRAEAERALLKPPTSWQAYDYFLRAAHIYNSEASDGTNEARALATRAVELDPQLAHNFAVKAVQLEPRLSQARAMLGYVLSRKGQHDAALSEFSRANECNPNYTDWRYLAALVLAGETEKAIQVSVASMRLDPFYPAAHAGWVGLAYYMVKRYADAASFLVDAIARAPVFRYGHLWLAATYAQQGNEKACACTGEVLRIDPQWTNEGSGRMVYRFKNARDIEHLLEGFRRAGLPDR